METVIGILALVGFVAVMMFVGYAFEHSPTARHGKYNCYASHEGKLCLRPISAERAASGRDCESCESKHAYSEDSR